MKYYIFLILFFSIIACKKETTTILEDNSKSPKFKKITCVSDNAIEGTFEVYPEYNTNGTLKQVKTVFSLSPNDTFIDEISETDNFFKIRFSGADNSSFSPLDPYSDLVFHYTNGRIDSIDYYEKPSVPYLGWYVKKMIFEYSGKIIDREYNNYYYQEGEKDVRQYNSVQYNSSGNVVSYVADSSDFNYEKIEFSYYEPSEWNMQAFNIYYFQNTKKGYGDLYASTTYVYPLFLSKMKFMGNKENTLIKTVRYSGYYYENGEKIYFDRSGELDYKFDARGRIIEMPNRNVYSYSGKFYFEYLD